MGVSIFEIIGPVMIGPSSSHTAGMARIGSMAYRIAGEKPVDIQLKLNPTLSVTYKGHRSDAALIGGAMGLMEDDIRLREAYAIAERDGITTGVDFLEANRYHQNTARVDMTLKDGRKVSVKGVSVGGGSLYVDEVDGVSVMLDADRYHVLAWESDPAALSALGLGGKVQGNSTFCVLSVEKAPDPALLASLPGRVHVAAPVLAYGASLPTERVYMSCQEALDEAKAQGISLAQLAINYEISRSGFAEADIRARMHHHLEVMKSSVAEGLSGKNKLLYNITGGQDAAMMQKAAAEGKTISGGLIPFAVAKALAVMEYNAAMGCLVAAPTAGSAGIVPGCMLQIQEAYGISDEKIEEAMFVSGLLGVIMSNRAVSFSGAVGGCQGEVGVSSAIAAAGLASVFTEDGDAVFHAMAMCLKNLLGLICDPIADPVEVPCIKRNTVGVANAFASCDMALAGIRSYIPPDEVIDALIDVEKRLPQELKGSTCGGLACTLTAKCLRKELRGE